ncbi:MAG: ATP-binding protein [Cytophagales bacterium]|nr:ATP-binding protein [Cytophagales bacterium]
MNAEKLAQMIQGGEDSSLELKRMTWRGVGKVNEPHPDSLANEMAAFANAKGGYVVLGVEDKTRDIVGIERDDLSAVEQWLGNLARDLVKPDLMYYTRHIKLTDSLGIPRYVVAIEIPRSLWIHKSPAGYLYRIGHEKREMSPDLLARMFQQRSQARIIRFEEQAVPNTSLADAVHTKHYVKSMEAANAAVQLTRQHLTAKDSDDVARLSVAGVLCCTDEPRRWLPGAYIQAVAYRGAKNDPADQVDAKDFTGSIDTQIWQAFSFVMRHMLIPATKDLGRKEFPQYSRRAVFEAIVNAVAHRDYSIYGARIRLFVFADRLLLCVPGVLPNTMTTDAMPSLSMPRNEVLTTLLSRIPVEAEGLHRAFLMDKRGAGVDVILTESESLSGKKPSYTLIGESELQLTIFAAPSPHDGSPSPTNLPSL